MKRFFAGLVLAVLAAGTAGAADLSYKGSGPTAVSPLSGFYAEFGVGYGFTQGEVSGLPAAGDLAATGTFFNARAGYDKAGLLGNRIGAGVYVQGSNAFDVNGKAGSGGDLITLGDQWGYGIGGKLFYDYGGGQVYALLGYEGQDVSLTGTGTHHIDGLLWGLGVSVKVAQNAYVGLEFNQIYRSDVSGTIGSIEDPVHWSLGGVDDRVSLRFGFSTGN